MPPLPADDAQATRDLMQLQEQAPADAVPVLQAWAQEAETQRRETVQALALCLLARVYSLVGQAQAAEQAANQAQGLYAALQDGAGQAMALNALAMLRMARGDYTAALDLLNRAIPLARAYGQAGPLIGLLNSLGNTLTSVREPGAAAQVFDECLQALPVDAVDIRHVAVRNNLAMALARWAELGRDAGLPRDQWMPRAERAVAEAEHALRQQQHLGTAAAMGGQDSMALALLVAGQPARALALMNDPAVLKIERNVPFDAVHIAQTRAQALLDLGRAPEAVDTCNAALARAVATGSEHHTDVLWLTLSHALETQGDLAAALHAHRRFHAVRERLVFDRAQKTARAVVSELDLARAQRESRVDALTGLANRRHFEERALQALADASPAQPLSLMVLDIDHFKQVNDTYGHLAGDQVLRQLADVLRSQCRGSEPPTRLGGDEFAVLVEVGADSTKVLAERIRKAFEQAQARASHGVRRQDAAGPHPSVTLSIGLASVTSNCPLEELMDRADRALYAAKNAGRNQVAEAPQR